MVLNGSSESKIEGVKINRLGRIGITCAWAFTRVIFASLYFMHMKTLPVLGIILLYSSGIWCQPANSRPRIPHKLIGNWEYLRVWVDGKVKDGLDSECGTRDVIQLKEGNTRIEYPWNDNILAGYEIGISNTVTCTLSPTDLKYEAHKNSCATYWISLDQHPRRLICLSEDTVAEYKITRLNAVSMTLKLQRIQRWSSLLLEKIELQKIP